MSANPYQAPEAAPALETPTRIRKRPARIDAIAATVFVALAIWFWQLSNWAVEDAIRQYGENVDSGVFEYFAATLYFLPAGVLLLLASVFLFRGWRLGMLVHCLAWAWVALPLGMMVYSELARLFSH